MGYAHLFRLLTFSSSLSSSSSISACKEMSKWKSVVDCVPKEVVFDEQVGRSLVNEKFYLPTQSSSSDSSLSSESSHSSDCMVVSPPRCVRLLKKRSLHYSSDTSTSSSIESPSPFYKYKFASSSKR